MVSFVDGKSDVGIKDRGYRWRYAGNAIAAQDVVFFFWVGNYFAEQMIFLICSYFLLELQPENARQATKLKQGEIYVSITNALKYLHGEQGVASQQGDIRIKYLNPETGIVFVRARRGPHVMVKDSIDHVSRIGSCVTKLKIIHVSGTMRSSQKRLLEHHRRHLLKMLGKCRTEQERQAIRRAMEGLVSNSGKQARADDMIVC